MRYRINGAVVGELWTENTIESLGEQLPSLGYNFNKCHQRLPLHTESSIKDIIDEFIGSLYSLRTEIRKLPEEQCKAIEITIEDDLDAIDAISRSIDSNFSQPGPSSWLV